MLDMHSSKVPGRPLSGKVSRHLQLRLEQLPKTVQVSAGRHKYGSANGIDD